MTSIPRFPPHLEFGAYLVYPPRRIPEGEAARTLVLTLKRDGPSLTPGVTLIQHFAAKLAADLPPVLRGILDGRAIAVPVPGSAIMRPQAIWASRSIACALEAVGLVAGVAPIVTRTTTIRKSAFCGPGERPDPREHYDTMTVTIPVGRPARVVLIDDVITRGATIAGAAARVRDVLPDADVVAFTMARTVNHFNGSIDPCRGTIVASAHSCTWSPRP